MSLEKEDTSKVDKNAVKDALVKLFAKNGVSVWSMHSKCPIYKKPGIKLTRKLGWSWKGKSLDGKKTFMVCFLGADGWSSWTREDTQKGKWLVVAEAIARGGGYLTYPLDDTEFRKAKFVEMPTSVEELLIKGDLS